MSDNQAKADVKEVDKNFDWIQLKKELDLTVGDDGKVLKGYEKPMDKLKRKFMEHPMIPIGAALTTTCLVAGVYSFARSNKKASQLFMRGRVVAQGITIIAILSSLGYNFSSKMS